MIDVSKLRQIVGEDWVITKRDQMERYLTDETAPPSLPKPAENVVVVKPANAGEISEILKLANREKTPVFVRGGGTGLTGAAVPTVDSIVLVMERLNKIEEVDKENFMVVAEAGATFGDMLHAIESAGLFFPPHPGDEGAQLGGLVACNAGGSRAVKYGIVRNYVKGLEVVLPDGELIKLGGKLMKNNQGLDLLHLMVNSSGILGVITRVILRVQPRAAKSATMVISYDNRKDAVASVPKILQSGVIPLAIEYADREVIIGSADHLGLKWPADKGSAYLIIILDGANDDEVYSQAERVSSVCEQSNAVDILMAESREEQANILKMRSEIHSWLKATTADILDITVPPASVGILADKIDEIARKYNTRIPNYGHAGDGNFHPNPLRDLYDRGLLNQVKREIYTETIKLGGVITGEHGIGQIRGHDLDLYPGERPWELMRQIKKIFDPNNILNPGVGIYYKEH